ncbi:MAG: hypothetical protein D3910_26695 [Candidatus Electrothrix sp. ATG2]|nr:hypothetical protein [Candidatus Electrothrix sp. ATG2]
MLTNRQSLVPVQNKGCAAVQIKHRPGQTTILGRLSGDEGLIQLREKVARHEIRLLAAEAVPGRNIARMWACDEAEHRLLTEKDSSVATALGQRYGVVTGGSSLLVLDSLEQYLEHGVEPPESEPELSARYKVRTKRIQQSRAKQRQKHLDKVHQQWQEMLVWWDTDFSGMQQRLTGEQSDQASNSENVVEVEEWGALVSTSDEPVAGSSRFRTLSSDLVADFDESPRSSSTLQINRLSVARRRAKQSGATSKHQASIRVQQWTPDMPYLQELEKTPAADRYQRYLELRENYTKSPSFFLDCGDYFLKHQMQSKGVRILSNLLELDLENPVLMRTCAYRLQQAGELNEAIVQ